MDCFISNAGFVHQSIYRDLLIYRCNFNASLFQSSLFSQLNIGLPKSLLKAVSKRKAEFLAGRFCAQQCLENLGIKNFELKIKRSKEPMWPTYINGSIAHTKSMATAIVSNNSHILGVGVDVSEIILPRIIGLIEKQIFFDIEYELYEQLDLNREFIFTLVFSVKECFFKAIFPSVGQYFGFDAVRIIDVDFDKKRVLLTLNKNLGTVFKKGAFFTSHFCFFNNKVTTILEVREL